MSGLVSIVNPKNLGEISDEVTYDSIYELAAIVSDSAWAPGIFSNRRRTISNLSRIDLLVLDIDSGCMLGEARELFKDFKHIIATSRNHQRPKNGSTCDRFRVVLFLSAPITNDKDFKATWNQAKILWPFIDEACKDSSRFFFKSPEVISVKEEGKLFEVVKAPEVTSSSALIKNDGRSSESKGELWKSTLEFLRFGAPAGTRHTRLVQAAGNMFEQGYSLPEVTEMVETMSTLPDADWTQVGLNDADRKTIERMSQRELKYEFKPKEEIQEAQSYVRADELLNEAFEYLSDKDKVKGEPTTIEGLDRLLGGGFRIGEMSVLMAAAKTGKNTLYHHLIFKHLQRGIPFGYASRELSPASEVIPNLLSIALGKNTWKADINSELRERSRQVIGSWQLYFAPGYGHFPLKDLEAWFRELKSIGVNHFLFDHFHYGLEGEDYEATAALIKKLKTLTKELDIHLNLIVQPRSLREGEQLSLATLRGGAAIGQALDNLLILERVRGQDNISKLTLEVARHKLAKLGSIYLQYDSETTSFTEVQKELIQDNPIPMGMNRNRFGRPNFYQD